MKVEFEPLAGHVPFDRKQPPTNLPKRKGQITMNATISINNDTGEITITEEKGRFKFSFVNQKLTNKWSDAVG